MAVTNNFIATGTQLKIEKPKLQIVNKIKQPIIVTKPVTKLIQEEENDNDELDEDALLLALEELDNAPLIKKPASY